MKIELKQKWVEALRSGNYLQTIGKLKRDNRFCCLGVLCDLIKDDYDTDWTKYFNPSHNPSEEEEIYGIKFDNYGPSTDRIPVTILNKIKLNSDDQAKLMDMNDTLGYKFNQIAEWIEENVEVDK